MRAIPVSDHASKTSSWQSRQPSLPAYSLGAALRLRSPSSALSRPIRSGRIAERKWFRVPAEAPLLRCAFRSSSTARS